MTGKSNKRSSEIKEAPRYHYGSSTRYHLQHVHLFASDIEKTITFYRQWFDAEVVMDDHYAGVRNVMLKIGIGAINLYDQKPRGSGKNAVHHLGMQISGLDDLYDRMIAAGLSIRNPIRRAEDGGGYFMVEGPDGVLIEAFEPRHSPDPSQRRFFGLEDDGPDARTER